MSERESCHIAKDWGVSLDISLESRRRAGTSRLQESTTRGSRGARWSGPSNAADLERSRHRGGNARTVCGPGSSHRSLGVRKLTNGTDVSRWSGSLEGGKTMRGVISACTAKEFVTDKWLFTIIDVPGHGQQPFFFWTQMKRGQVTPKARYRRS